MAYVLAQLVLLLQAFELYPELHAVTSSPEASACTGL